MHRMLYLHRYHGAVTPMALIAHFAAVSRSTNRSTPHHHGDHRMPTTERYRRQRGLMLFAKAGSKWIVYTPTRPKIPRLTPSCRDHVGQDRGVESAGRRMTNQSRQADKTCLPWLVSATALQVVVSPDRGYRSNRHDQDDEADGSGPASQSSPDRPSHLIDDVLHPRCLSS
jgi:hypothetical protein